MLELNCRDDVKSLMVLADGLGGQWRPIVDPPDCHLVNRIAETAHPSTCGVESAELDQATLALLALSTRRFQGGVLF